MKLLLSGILIGLLIAGLTWTLSSQIVMRQPVSPYWSVAGTQPEKWLYPEREKTGIRAGDIEDCHGFVTWMQSKAYEMWEDRVREFGKCMENKGYEFDGPRKTTTTFDLGLRTKPVEIRQADSAALISPR